MDNKPKIDPFLMVILSRNIETIIKEMTNALLKSGRSGVLNTARDFSCSLTDNHFQVISAENSAPIHVTSIDLIPKAVAEEFGEDMAPGDCFVNNSAYHGNTHCADFTLCAPVFYEGEFVFFCISRAHFADMGFPIPGTYHPAAKDIYEEGLQLPCIRIQRDYKDVKDVIKTCKANIRVPEQFYGDYLAALAAVRTGEKRLIELCDKYGIDNIKSFMIEWQNYAERITIEAIRKLPKGTWKKEASYDSELDTLPDRIPIRVELTIDPVEGYITVDVTDNIDNVPLGINLSEATTLAGIRNGIFYCLDPNIPHCSGSFRRVKINMREGAIVGKPRFPAATCTATTNVGHLLPNLIQSMFADVGDGLGIAQGNSGIPPAMGIVSGRDYRRDGKPFVNQIFIGYFGGPALQGHDGWLTYGSPGGPGFNLQGSVEIIELQQPLLIEKCMLGCDSGGAGEYEGAPGSDIVYHSRRDTLRWTYNSCGRKFPPEGVRGGMSGRPCQAWKIDDKGSWIELPITADLLLRPGEKLVSKSCGGGGYGDPLDREPNKVRWRAREGWISIDKAKDTYGVILDTSVEEYRVDQKATKMLRDNLRKKGAEI